MVVSAEVEEMYLCDWLAMEQLGWVAIQDDKPDEEKRMAVERFVSQTPTLESPPFSYCKGGEECQRYLNLGDKVKGLIEHFFGTQFQNLKIQGPVVINSTGGMDNQMPRPMRAHPSRDGLSIYRPLRQKLDWRTGLFNVYSSSHTVTDTQFEQCIEKVEDEIVLDNGELLLVHGGLYILPSPNVGGSIVWIGFSRTPMGSDVYSPSALPFMKI